MSNELDSPLDLSSIEQEIINFFIRAAQAIGLPKSIGEIYGLFFASEDPLALDDVIDKLKISKGSASQGLRFLKNINAINPTYLPGDRRDHYTVETSLRRIADGYIKERVSPQLQDGAQRLSELKDQYSSSELGYLRSRLKTLQTWSKKAEMLIPVVGKFLGPKDSRKII